MTSRARLAALAMLAFPALTVPSHAAAQYRPPLVMSRVVRDTLAVDSFARTDTMGAIKPSHRYAVVGGVLGFALPGLGHVYSSEWRRGGVVFLVTMTGAFFALSDPSPQAAAAVGSVFYVGGWLFSVVDGAFAAGRYNRRHEAAVARVP